jgi:hypothetical protein
MASAETIFTKFINSVFIFVNDQNCNYQKTGILLTRFLCACGDILQHTSIIILRLLINGYFIFLNNPIGLEKFLDVVVVVVNEEEIWTAVGRAGCEDCGRKRVIWDGALKILTSQSPICLPCV